MIVELLVVRDWLLPSDFNLRSTWLVEDIDALNGLDEDVEVLEVSLDLLLDQRLGILDWLAKPILLEEQILL